MTRTAGALAVLMLVVVGVTVASPVQAGVGVPTRPRSAAVADLGNGTARLTWRRPRSNGGAPIVDYVVARRVDGGSWRRVRDGVGTERVATVPANDGHVHDYRVAATNANGRGRWSRTATLDLTAPSGGFGDGTWLVGSDIEPGRYVALAPSGVCSWARLSAVPADGIDDIIASYAGTGQALADISSTDVGFQSSCGSWVPVSEAGLGARQSIGDGTWLVGVQMAAGTWQTTPPGTDCYSELLSSFSGELDAIIANGYFVGEVTVTLTGNESGFRSSACGTWTKVPSG